ncbi:putative ubiquitin-like-specific protease 1B [Andrographis paniculata]|uniref:putative ubiquitin-like-specific protease 1B n=1 Tax=Andrographis paniculata TaxID=175694 RepID=UPI0021E9422E|nr:putative ubiquitin-like-specific protease 1B [Andrographis paniculata]
MGNCLGSLFQFLNVRRLGASRRLKLSPKPADSSSECPTAVVTDDSDRCDVADALRVGESGDVWEVRIDLGVVEESDDFTKRRSSLEAEYNDDECRLLLHKAQKIKQDAVEECFAPLTAQEEALVAQALSISNRGKVLVSHKNSGIDITGKIFECLRIGAWLNDEDFSGCEEADLGSLWFEFYMIIHTFLQVINLYFELLKEREQREPRKFLKCHFFNTFFYKKLISGGDGYNFQAVRRWTTQRKLGYHLMDCEKIFVPIHKELHWCLAIINKKDEKFQYLDSLYKGVDSQVLHVLARYYVDEAKDKSGVDIDVSSWKKECVVNLPRQENGSDCGMFMIKYVDFHSRNIGLCFDQGDMPYFRQRTAKEILNLKAE